MKKSKLISILFLGGLFLPQAASAASVNAYITSVVSNPVCFSNPVNAFERLCLEVGLIFYDETTPDIFGVAAPLNSESVDIISQAMSIMNSGKIATFDASDVTQFSVWQNRQ